ncbi:MAG TPA: chemotaxis protein CheB [bacterium]|nr:chemotaxis protein CheB [bacterium]
MGIGASAGGLEALKELVENLQPDTGMAFVYIQHMLQTWESMLVSIISKWTTMPVLEVKQDTAVNPNHIYIMPPKANLILQRGFLKPVKRNHGDTRYFPIDEFLLSLAADRGSRAVGVVLSGNASDGSKGMGAIKAEGGVTFAQEPDTAKFDGMPRSAVSTGAVDFVMPPAKIAQELLSISRHPYVHAARPDIIEKVLPDRQEVFLRIFTLLKQATGTDFTYYKKPTIKRRILRRMVLLKMDNIEQYVRYLRDNKKEIQALYQDLLINVTGFFRDPETFSGLKAKVFPQLLKNHVGDQPIRIWVTACASGEEAYSVAMALVEYLGDKAQSVPVQIFATDLNETAIERARQGIYRDNQVQDLSSERLGRFFMRLDSGYQIRKPIRDMCIFARQNIFKDPPFSNIDLITCRNLLIYLEPILQKKVLLTFHYALKPNGYLFLGSAESPGPISHLFSPVSKKHKIYAKKNQVSRLVLSVPLTPEPDEIHSRRTPQGREPAKRGGNGADLDLMKEADRLVLSQYAPPSVVVNEDMEILQFRGQTDPYLWHPQGSASLNLTRMIHKDLAMDLRAAIHKAKIKNMKVRMEGLAMRGNRRAARVDITVVPLASSSAREKCFLVLFEGSAEKALKAPLSHGPGTEAGRRKMSDMRRELLVTKEYLQSIVEQQELTNQELRSANEEILSNNEELQSTNEELETAKEELQSTNEELTTVNEELQNRNVELSKVYDDLNNMLKSINVAIVILGKDLKIRKFTAMAEKTFNLISSDVGRSITDISPNVTVSNLSEMIRETVDSLGVKEMEVQDKSGRWYLLHIRPYQTSENKIDGVVIALIDFNVLKQNINQLKYSEEMARGVAETVKDGLLILDPHYRIKIANRSFCESFHLSPSQVENAPLFELDGGGWDLPELRKLFDDALAQNTTIQNYDLDLPLVRTGPKKIFLSAKPILGPERRLLIVILSPNPRTVTPAGAQG